MLAAESSPVDYYFLWSRHYLWLRGFLNHGFPGFLWTGFRGLCVRVHFSWERVHNFHQILRGACDSENIRIIRTTLYKFRRKRKGGREGKRKGKKDELEKRPCFCMSYWLMRMTHYVNVYWLGCLPEGLSKIKRTQRVKYTSKHWNCKAHHEKESTVISLDKWMNYSWVADQILTYS